MFTPEALAKLGLPADATDEQINAAILAKVTSEPGSGGGDGGEGDGGGAGDGDGGKVTQGQPTPAETTPAAPGTGGDSPDPGSEPSGTPTGGEDGAPAGGTGTGELQVPPGTVLVDEAQWAEVTQEIAASKAKRTADAATERARLVDDAIRAGKFPRARRDHYLLRLQSDPEGARQEIAAMQATVPVQERGTSNAPADGQEGVPADAAYPDSWKPSVAASRRGMGSRIKVVGD